MQLIYFRMNLLHCFSLKKQENNVLEKHILKMKAIESELIYLI